MSADGARRIVALEGQRYVTLSAAAYIVYEARRRGDDIESIRAALQGHCGRAVDLAEVEAAIGVLATKIDGAATTRRSEVRLLRVALIPALVVNAIAQRLTGLFARWPALLVVGLTIVAVTQSLRRHHAQALLPGDWFVAYGLFLATIVAHEFGHATACRAAGEPAGEIGFTAFYVFPALYTDVSRAWLLDRKGRLAVDIGGVYFQLPLLALIAVSDIVAPATALFAAELLIVAGIALNLNPVLRLDGYWLLADALDLPRLSQAPIRLLRDLRARAVPLAGRPRWQVVVVGVYGVLNAAAWLYAAAAGAYVLARGPANMRAAWDAVSMSAPTAGSIIHLGATLMSIVLIAYGLAAIGARALTLATGLRKATIR